MHAVAVCSAATLHSAASRTWEQGTARPFLSLAGSRSRTDHLRSGRAAHEHRHTAVAMRPATHGLLAAGVAGAAAVTPVDDRLLAAALKRWPRIILGTSSSARQGVMDELAAQHGFQYEIAKAGIDESAIRHDDAQQLVLSLAHAKAEAIKAMLREQGSGGGGLLVTCDQVVLHEGKILEKPADEAHAREFIAGYARAPAATVGSVVLTDLATGRSWEGVDIAEIHFEAIPPASVDALIAEGEVYWCAGGLMVEHELMAPHVTHMEGSLDSVMGLAKHLLLRLLCQAAEEAPSS